jgi:hypothetical protein
LRPQYWHVNESRLNTSKRVAFEIGLRFMSGEAPNETQDELQRAGERVARREKAFFMSDINARLLAVSSIARLDGCAVTQSRTPAAKHPRDAPEKREKDNIRKNVNRDASANDAKSLCAVAEVLGGEKHNRARPNTENPVTSRIDVQPRASQQ